MSPGSAGSRPRASAGRVSVPRSMARICKHRQRERDRAAGKGEDEEGNDLGDGVREDVEDEFADVVVDAPAFLDGGDDGGEVVVGEDHGAPPRGRRRCPDRPMATPMSARRRAGASLTPSPVMATICALGSQRVGDAQLGLRGAAGEDDLARRGEQWSRSASLMASSSSPVTMRALGRADADLAGDLGGGERRCRR